MAANQQAYHHSGLEVVPPTAFPQPKYDTGFGYVEGQPRHEPGPKTVLGLQPLAFWLLAALIFVLLAAGIGGGVGGTLAVNNAKSECKAANLYESVIYSAAKGTTATVTTTITRSEAATFAATPTADALVRVPATGTLALGCPQIDNTNLRITHTDTVSLFEITCGQDIAGPDIIAIISYSHTDCAKACAAYNNNLGSRGCKAAVFNSDLTGSVSRNYGTCFLKNSTGSISASTWNSYAGLILQ